MNNNEYESICTAIQYLKIYNFLMVLSAGAVEYTDCFCAEG